ncbi:putative helix-loop-helix DNA-binding domain-containing protein [Rosellinia necatrix]|uniref:Putative helix-loop-helix DNA-binding domain-containing protein n=1 Tax=Rosellinia necatrix TaxID=77044 RepID=A0A1S7UK10_ROSNE|nr:putative helix-loop-helix DNA-binding domain-containing protein [Rosellinia necatrix]
MTIEQQQQRLPPQKLPAGLATVLNAPEEHRDSAYYSSTDASSKHNSAASGIGIIYHAAQEKTPSPTTTTIPQPLVSPSGNMSVASMVSPTSPGSIRFERPLSLESVPTSMGPDSRRESVDSRINQGFGDLRLSGSPYASANQSTTSIHASLAQQRNPRTGMDHLSVHRISNGYQPSVERTPESHPKTRTAPAITGPATSTIARAAEPTKGQAWAFPEDEIQRVPPGIGNGTFLDSRRSSVAESIASSQFTADSRLPPGQRRLEDAMGPDFRMSGNSADFQTVHHHTLQHKQLSDLQSEESSPHSGTQPYSRTPELRVSHKLAERKRRTEMKELFEQLRDLMPQERGSKASKWEILSKAIAEHQRQSDHIKQLTTHYQAAMSDIDMLRRDLDRLRMENNQLRNGAAAGSGPGNQSAAAQQPPADPYAQDPYGRGSRPELPPLRALSGNLPNGPESMTGVQYDGQRSNGFRQERF